MLKRPTGLTSLLKDVGRVSGAMVGDGGLLTTAARGRTRVWASAQGCVSNSLELVPDCYFVPSEPERVA